MVLSQQSLSLNIFSAYALNQPEKEIENPIKWERWRGVDKREWHEVFFSQSYKKDVNRPIMCFNSSFQLFNVDLIDQ